ncbi:MAG: 5-formyltetrahydrofolate cyclo-ligase [Deltaproteobacteria bacterium]|nr:5-formyltetrahydrofolate cyclo-ligase [Deltaproteobacteria bacterium]
MMPDKPALRKILREQRHTLTDKEVLERSLAAQRHVLEAAEWLAASSVGLYAAVNQETDTALLLEEAWATGKEVYLPCIAPASPGEMRLLPCLGGQALVKNRFGIPEPIPETCPAAPEGEWIPGIIIVPGLAFDREGHRLGTGGGYYDRLFARKSMQDTVRIGLAYAFQIVESLPADEWDAPMHAIATEEGLTWL